MTCYRIPFKILILSFSKQLKYLRQPNFVTACTEVSKGQWFYSLYTHSLSTETKNCGAVLNDSKKQYSLSGLGCEFQPLTRK